MERDAYHTNNVMQIPEYAAYEDVPTEVTSSIQ